MDGIFGVIDSRFKVSIVDSTMMWIVHRAMDKAHERVKSREGVIERLHEISKFYELSVMQLDGCIKFVQEETDTQNPESSHEEVLAGLAEIRNRLQRRLYESELAILQKDRELADRFESEVKLRQALETTERELVSSQEDLELERSRSAGSSNLSPHEGEDDEDRDGEFGELKDSVDRQVWKIKEKLEFDDNEPKVKRQRNHCINDVRVEEMGSDIDILKETLDIAFGKMQSAIFISEMGPIEQQVKSSIENDIISICLKGFSRDCQEDLEAEATRKEKKVSVALNGHWSDLMNEVTGLCEDLKPLIGQNEMQPQKGEGCNILDFGSRSPKREEKSSQVHLDGSLSEYGINTNELEDERGHESIIKKRSEEADLVQLKPEMLQEKTSLSSRREESLERLKSRFQEVLENLMIFKAKVNKILGQNGNFNEEDIPLEKKEQVFTENHRQKSDVDSLADVWGKMHQLQDEENIGIQNQICILRQEREDVEFQNIMMEEIYITLFQGLREKFCNDLNRLETEILIADGICRDIIRNKFNQLDKTMESFKIEVQIKDDVYHVVFKEAMKDYDFELDRLEECKIRHEIYAIPFTVMLKEWHKNIEEHKTESLLREEISGLVFSETIKSISYKANHSPHTKFFNDFLKSCQITIKEDVCSVFLREKVMEWEEKIEASNLETLIREEICYTILNEAEREVCNRCKQVDVAIQDGGAAEKPSSRERLGEGTEIGMGSLIQKLSLLSEGIEVVKNLVLNASFEIKNNNCNLKPMALGCGIDESKATTIDAKDIQCILNSLSIKLEKTMNQFNDKLFVGALKPSSETIVSEPRNVCQISPVDENVPDRKLSLLELHDMQQLNKSDSTCLKLPELPHIPYDFELIVNRKLESIMLRYHKSNPSKKKLDIKICYLKEINVNHFTVDRLEEMKHSLDPVPRVMASLRENESLYKKAFIRRCQNLRKAENEVLFSISHSFSLKIIFSHLIGFPIFSI
ncbi:uncharacterized protein LOC120081046 [Benincasa hispida]|uniref:uncharacterized protein LOC120081046 n=1 Tax=Benincasa hispida TaxID=102211 RepID=UPI0018FF13AE|nr:uncharacterized protein LOC120081046 [Benincasa hispida]